MAVDSSLGASFGRYLALVEAGGRLTVSSEGALLILLDLISSAGGWGFRGGMGGATCMQCVVWRAKGAGCNAWKAPVQCPHACRLSRLCPFLCTGGAFDMLQRTRVVAACRPLHPDAVAMARGLQEHYGLQPIEAGAAIEAGVAAAAPAALAV